MRKIVCLITASVFTLAYTGTALAAPTTRVVGQPGQKGCDHPQYLTITAAVGASSPGDTIKVCAGVYTEPSIQVTIPLTIIGAQNGDARSNQRQTDASKESIVVNNSGDGFDVSASNVTISGFTIEGDNSATNAPAPSDYPDAGISLQNGATAVTGDSFVNDVVSQFGLGLYIAGNTAQDNLTVMHNAFLANNRGYANNQNDAPAGGIFTAGGGPGTTNSRMNENLFADNEQFAINVGEGSSGGLQINHNTSTNDGTLLVLGSATGTHVTDNSGSQFSGSGILLFGNDHGVDVANNTLTGNGTSTGGNGISVHLYTFFGVTTDNTDLMIENNKVSNFSVNGINLRDSIDGTVRNNHLTNNLGDGILAGTSNSDETVMGNTIEGNNASGNAVFDCEDQTSPLADSWIHDMGKTSSPPGLCKAH